MSYETDTEDRLKELFELSRLYDLYGSLLSEHNRSIFEDYILNNYSLSEIADEMGMSRQGVRDIVVRYSGKLKDYEKKLDFLHKIDSACELLDELEEAVRVRNHDYLDPDIAELIQKVRNILEA